MSHRPIIDAGPGLNFLSINKERLLIEILGPLSTPETVQDEVLRKARQDARFRSAAVVWQKLTPKWVQILSDDQTPELAAVVHRITQLPMEERLKHPKDLGETMVIAHAVVAAESGETVTVLIDDGPGARIATSEINRLRRLRASGQAVGSILLVSTLTILERAAGGQHIPDKATMRNIYDRLRGLDDGLPPIQNTNLLSAACWSYLGDPRPCPLNRKQSTRSVLFAGEDIRMLPDYPQREIQISVSSLAGEQQDPRPRPRDQRTVATGW